jgi:hypothetical protein
VMALPQTMNDVDISAAFSVMWHVVFGVAWDADVVSYAATYAVASGGARQSSSSVVDDGVGRRDVGGDAAVIGAVSAAASATPEAAAQTPAAVSSTTSTTVAFEVKKGSVLAAQDTVVLVVVGSESASTSTSTSWYKRQPFPYVLEPLDDSVASTSFTRGKAAAYLGFIVDNYDRLPNRIVFTHTNSLSTAVSQVRRVCVVCGYVCITAVVEVDYLQLMCVLLTVVRCRCRLWLARWSA